MILSCIALPSLAEEAASAYMQYAQIPADEASGQKELRYIEGVTALLDVDGLKFKDMNGNGELDGYEDWRLDTDARITDLRSQMTLEEKAGLVLQTAPYQPIDDNVLYSEAIPLE